MHENHYRNIRFSEAFPSWMRRGLALWVRMKEKLTSSLFHHFILAENAYQHELTFVEGRFTVIENRALLPEAVSRKTNTESIQLIFTGTIAKSTGVFRAIELAESIHLIDQTAELTIIGYCALENTRAEIRRRIKGKSFIKLIGFDRLVPHKEIIYEIGKASYGIIYYPPLPHTLGSVPTKLYEYMAYQLPIITWANQTFADLVIQHNAGIILSETNDKILGALKTKRFYPHPVENVLWEEERFISLIGKLLG